MAACSVVTRDVGPYSVVGGNPAGFIKKRFDDELTGLLLELKWWDFSPEDLAGFLPVLCETDLEKVKEILKKRLGK